MKGRASTVLQEFGIERPVGKVCLKCLEDNRCTQRHLAGFMFVYCKHTRCGGLFTERSRKWTLFVGLDVGDWHEIVLANMQRMDALLLTEEPPAAS